MKEIWKPIPDYEGYYEASNTGKIRSVERTIVLKDRNGNPRPSIYKSRVLSPHTKTYARNGKRYYDIDREGSTTIERWEG